MPCRPSPFAIKGFSTPWAFRGGALADESREEPDDKIWHVVVMRPGSDPVEGLKNGFIDAAKLLGLSIADQSQLRKEMDISDPGQRLQPSYR
jgi:hypothetical protein